MKFVRILEFFKMFKIRKMRIVELRVSVGVMMSAVTHRRRRLRREGRVLRRRGTRAAAGHRRRVRRPSSAHPWRPASVRTTFGRRWTWTSRTGPCSCRCPPCPSQRQAAVDRRWTWRWSRCTSNYRESSSSRAADTAGGNCRPLPLLCCSGTSCPSHLCRGRLYPHTTKLKGAVSLRSIVRRGAHFPAKAI